MTAEQYKMADYDVFVRALNHYAKKFEVLKEDDELRHGGDLLTKDIDSNIEHIKNIAKDLEVKRFLTTLQDNRRLVVQALLSYYEDLTNSKQILAEKINADWDYSLENVNDEIYEVERRLKILGYAK